MGGGGAKKTEPVALRPRPAGTHEEPALASWASVPRPDAASSRGPVLPPASPTLHRSPRPGLRGFRGQQVLCSGTDTARQLLQVGTCPRCCLGRPHAGRPFTPAAKPTQVRDPHPSNEYSRVISFRMDWLDLLAFQGSLKSLLQHHSSNASILRCSAFFIVQISYPYMTTGKTIALTRRTLVGKVTSLF